LAAINGDDQMETKNLPARPEDVADVMLSETTSSALLLRFKKGDYFIGDDQIEVGHEFRAYPFDALKGFVRWEDNTVSEQRLGRIADRFELERDELPADEDWKEQRVLPLEDFETGDFVAFASGSYGGKRAINDLIRITAQAVKSGRGDQTPIIKLAVSHFTSKEYGKIPCPKFEVVNEPPKPDDMTDEIPF
jgi:hypothetical protein